MAQAQNKVYFPFINFGKLFTTVVIVNYDKSNDTLTLTTRMPKSPETNAQLTLPGDVTVTYSKLNGDPQGITIGSFEEGFLNKHPTLKETWPQIKTGKPTLRRVETTPFLQGLFDWVREYAVDHQEKAPPLQWML